MPPMEITVGLGAGRRHAIQVLEAGCEQRSGTHNPLIVYWPKGIRDKGGIRTQYSHVIDLLPTTLDLVGIKAPEQIRGIKQQPIEGTSLAYSIDDAKAATRHTLQYYYIFGSRSIYDNGWKAELAYQAALSLEMRRAASHLMKIPGSSTT